MLAGVWARLAAGAAVLLAALGGLAAVRRSGARAQQVSDLTREAAHDRQANDERSAVDRLSDRGVADELRRDWTRNG